MSKIPLSIPLIRANEWKYIKECLDTNWVSSAGSYVNKFEEQLASYTNSNNAIACVNGTAALQVCLRLAGVKTGNEVIVPTLTFIAPVNAINYNGAYPVFMDADEYYNLNIEKTIDFILNETEFKNGVTINKFSKAKIAALIVVNVWGNAVWLDELIEVCQKRNIEIIEDASESLGTKYTKGKYTGKHAGTVSNYGCISFNGNKIITTGGGGMILTKDKSKADKAHYLITQAKDDSVRYIHNSVGYNFRLTNVQAAMGVAQLEQLPNFLKKKKKIFNFYKNSINEIEGLKIADVPFYSQNNHWMNVLQINYKKYHKNVEQLMQHLKNNNIETRPVWALNHLQVPYQKCQNYKIEIANKLVQKSLCIPSSTSLSNEDLTKIIETIRG